MHAVSAPRFLIDWSVPDGSRIDETAKRFNLDLCFEACGVRVFVSPGYAIRINGNRGVFLGTLFERNGPPEPLVELDEDQQNVVAAKGAPAVLTSYWGAYCALLREGTGFALMRDPSGGLPAYYTSTPGSCVIGSDPEIIAETGYWTPAVSWDDLAAHMYARGLPKSVTPLRGLSELLPGTACCICDSSMRIEAIWSPWDHAQPETASDISGSSEILRRTIQNVVSPWSSRYPSILIGVSGGLDSSIIAASISARRARVTGVTLVTNDPDGDERLFTRLLSEGIGIEILDVRYDPADIDLGISCVRHLARPIGRSHALAYDRAMHRIARERGVDAFFSGNGGDNVFYYTQSANPIADRLLADGPGIGVLHTWRDVCRLTGCTPIEAAGATIGSVRSRGRGYQWSSDSRFLDAGLVVDLAKNRVSHPWLADDRARLPGKAAHIAALLRIQSGLEGYDRRLPPMINPLMSQPVLETCLAVPTWKWVEGGRDRALARSAFSHILPQGILERRTKGGPDGFANQIIAMHRIEILDRLTSGYLARRKIIDCDEIASALSDDKPTMGTDQARLLSLVDTEAWVAHWSHWQSSSSVSNGDVGIHFRSHST
ncbi:asparagine synthase-related protein [Sphingobium lactosutens]|uniref:asparagine synthase-related protein n=1 Tax=Sphingobium lactosutens TaxID=522773 RepID=UPI000A05981F|nr:asparagine synthetase B family protein [Sphingobium lactosutens]